MNRKQILTLSTITALFLVACGETSSVPSSESSSVTPSSSVVPSTSIPSSSSVTPSSSSEPSSSVEDNETWGIINGDFEDETDDFEFNSFGWNTFIGGAVDGIVATASYKTEGDNQYGSMNIESITASTQWWHAQLRQNGVYLNALGSYILSFKVRATAARTIRVQIQGGGLTAKPSALNELAVQVGTSWETKTINFTAPSDANSAELQFGLGPDSFLPSDLVGFARSFAEVHIDDVRIQTGAPLPNQAPTITGGDLLVKVGSLLLVRSGLVVRDDYDRNLSITNVVATDITVGTQLNTSAPVPGIYTFRYEVTDSEGLVGSHIRNIIVTDENQLLNNTQFTQAGPADMPAGWSKFSDEVNGGQTVTTGVMPHLLPESLLGNVVNGNFSDATENFENSVGWKTYIGAASDGIQATMGITDGVGVFTTTASTSDTNFWHGQILQENIRLPIGNFTLSFRAKTSEARTIRVALAGGNIVSTGRAIDEVPVVLGTEWETFEIDFTTTGHSNGAVLQFFTGRDQSLPSNLAALYANKTGTVYLDDVMFKYENAASPVATLIPTLAVELLKIVDDGNPWENQVKYDKIQFFQGQYRLNFKAYSVLARPIILAMEGDGGVAQPNLYRTVELSTSPQAFSYDMDFVSNSTNGTRNLQFFMGSYKNYATLNWDGLTPVGIEDNILTKVYIFDLSLVKVA